MEIFVVIVYSNTLVLQRGSVVWSKTLGTWLIFDTDEAGDYFYDPRKSNDDEAQQCYSIADVGLDTLEAPARQLHVDAAHLTTWRYRSALNKAWVHFNDKLWGNPGNKRDYVDGFQAALHFVGLRLAESEPKRPGDDE